MFSIGPDLTNKPLGKSDIGFSLTVSFMDQEQCQIKCVIVTFQETTEAKALPSGTSVQKTELFALRRALHLSKNKMVNIYTNSSCAFSVVHVQGVIWKEEDLLTSSNDDIKHTSEILALL